MGATISGIWAMASEGISIPVNTSCPVAGQVIINLDMVPTADATRLPSFGENSIAPEHIPAWKVCSIRTEGNVVRAQILA